MNRHLVHERAGKERLGLALAIVVILWNPVTVRAAYANKTCQIRINQVPSALLDDSELTATDTKGTP